MKRSDAAARQRRDKIINEEQRQRMAKQSSVTQRNSKVLKSKGSAKIGKALAMKSFVKAKT